MRRHTKHTHTAHTHCILGQLHLCMYVQRLKQQQQKLHFVSQGNKIIYGEKKENKQEKNVAFIVVTCFCWAAAIVVVVTHWLLVELTIKLALKLN